ncbi:MAG: SRPBCC family protein [Chloroflexota bacterium]
MRYQIEVIIDLPRDRVIELFDNPDNMPKWQPTLTNFEHLEGEAGQAGAKSRLTYKLGNRNMEMIETIIERNLPEKFSGTYETDSALNINHNTFHVISDNQTKWVTDTEFEFRSLSMKLMGLVAPFLFKNQTRKFMNDFKTFAENA